MALYATSARDFVLKQTFKFQFSCQLNGFNFQLSSFNLKIYFVNQYTPFSAFSPNAYSPFILPEIFFTFPVLSIW